MIKFSTILFVLVFCGISCIFGSDYGIMEKCHRNYDLRKARRCECKWEEGDEVQIYSKSQKDWFDGTVDEIIYQQLLIRVGWINSDTLYNKSILFHEADDFIRPRKATSSKSMKTCQDLTKCHKDGNGLSKLIEISKSVQKEETRRNRLLHQYGAANLIPKIETKDCDCAVCRKNLKDELTFVPNTDDDGSKKLCNECYVNSRDFKIGDQVIIKTTSPTRNTTIGRIVKQNETDEAYFDVKLLEGSKNNTIIPIHSTIMQKVIQELLPKEEKCEVCDNFIFNEKKCERKNCDPVLCGACHSNCSFCPYCKLLHKGAPIYIERNVITPEKREELDDVFGGTPKLLYGTIDMIEFIDETYPIYYVTLAKDYHWENDHKIVLEGLTHIMVFPERRLKPLIRPENSDEF